MNLFSDQGKLKLKRSTAAIFIMFKIIDLIWLYLWPEGHHIARLTASGVSDGVLIALIGFNDGLVWGALMVYGWAKAKGAD